MKTRAAFARYIADKLKMDFKRVFAEFEVGASKIKWWHKLLLPFCSSRVSHDGEYEIETKELLGKTFVIDFRKRELS